MESKIDVYIDKVFFEGELGLKLWNLNVGEWVLQLEYGLTSPWATRAIIRTEDQCPDNHERYELSSYGDSEFDAVKKVVSLIKTMLAGGTLDDYKIKTRKEILEDLRKQK